MQGNINRFASDHDVILVYSKSGKFQFNKLREKREKPVQQIKRVWDKATQSLVNGKDETIDVSKVAVSMNGIELQDREFFAAIKEGREPNASVAQVLPCYQVLHNLEQQVNAG